MKTPLAAVAFAAAAFFSSTPAALALNNRSWVAHNGNDHNDCTLDHPCRTFQRAHDMTVANGEVDVVDPADYGQVLINHSIIIDGGNMGYIYANPGPAIKTTTAGQVTIRNLSIESDGFYSSQGVYFAGTGDLYLDHVSINGQEGIFVDAVPLFLPGTRPRGLHLDGVKVQNTPVALLVFNPGGLVVGLNIDIRNCDFEGGYNIGSTTGLSIALGRVVITNSRITGFDTALLAYGADVNVSECTLSHSGTAISAQGPTGERGAGAVVRIASNDIVDNTTAFSTAGAGQIVSFGTNRTAGNMNVGATPVKADLN